MNAKEGVIILLVCLFGVLIIAPQLFSNNIVVFIFFPRYTYFGSVQFSFCRDFREFLGFK